MPNENSINQADSPDPEVIITEVPEDPEVKISPDPEVIITEDPQDPEVKISEEPEVKN